MSGLKKKGYYRFPDVRNNEVCFVSEDDVWQVPVDGGIARRLTANLGVVTHPKISPNGKWLLYFSAEEGGGDLYLLPLEGGETKRITFYGMLSRPLLWADDSKSFYFSANFEQRYGTSVYQLSINGGEADKLPVGDANRIAFGQEGASLLGRHIGDPARWKRYKGGTAGALWIDRKGNGQFEPFLNLKGNIADPIWVKNRIYFISDHEAIGNVYSCSPTGKNIQQHTHHTDFYVRGLSSDGKHLVYHAGCDLYAYELASDEYWEIEIDYRSSHTQLNRKFVSANQYLSGYSLSGDGKHVGISSRGKAISINGWDAPAKQWGFRDGARYRFPTWLQDKKSLVFISDEMEGAERVVLVNDTLAKEKDVIFEHLEIGIARSVIASPKENKILVTNHRNELLLLDLTEGTRIVLDKSDYARITAPSWSFDGKWITYSFPDSPETKIIKVVRASGGKTHAVTASVRWDRCPVFSSDGKFIFFSGDREYEAEYDSMQFELSFRDAAKLYAIPLLKETKSPFSFNKGIEPKRSKKSKAKTKLVKIEFDGILDRIIPFPLPSGDYFSLQVHEDKLYFLQDEVSSDGSNHRNLCSYSFGNLEKKEQNAGINSYQIALGGEKTIIWTESNQLIVTKTGDEVNDKADNFYSPEGGRVNLAAIKIEINRTEEWKQMYREAWLKQREHFWTENMSGVDWIKVFKHYFPLIERVGSRGEFSDLIWEMQGELGTSHCYEMGGDYRSAPYFNVGKLGCSYELASDGVSYVITSTWIGAADKANQISPLKLPGVNINVGDRIYAIDGRELSAELTPRACLVNKAGVDIALTVKRKGDRRKRDVVVKTLMNEKIVLYRQWVEANKKYVHKKSRGKVGYVHIPDMGVFGFEEFHRHYLVECQYDSLLVDVRYNGGGHVSQLLLEKLNRKRLGYDLSRWNKEPEPYPGSSVAGPMVALTNEYAGSDGDIFSHAFKMMDLGKLIGKRTWGGVIGINMQYSLVDGAKTSQPEYSFWFNDVGWGVENYGTDPDIEISIKPQDYANGKDPQLEGAVNHLLAELKQNPVVKPKLNKRPNLALPKMK